MFGIDYLKNCRAFYSKELEKRYGIPVGASESSVTELQQKLDFELPESYRQFLLWMGNDRNGALRGSEWFCDDIVPNGEFLDEFLIENNVHLRSTKRVCFFVHQGYMAAWFDDEGTPDPKCSFLSESNCDLVRDAGPFSSFLLKELQGVAAASTQI